MSLGTRLQLFINGLSSGTGSSILRSGFIILAAAGVLTLYATTRFRGYAEPLAMEHAETARHIANGNGWKTGLIRPFDHAWLSSNNKGSEAVILPVTRHPPLYPHLLASLLPQQLSARPDVSRTPPVIELRVLAINGILTLLAALFVYISARGFCNPGTAFTSACVLITSNAMLGAMTAGHQGPLVACLTAAALWPYTRAVNRHTRGAPEGLTAVLILTSGIIAGGAVSAAYQALIIAGALLVLTAIEFRQSRWLGWPLFLIGMLGIVIPLMVLTHARTGGIFGTAPFTLLNDTFTYPGNSLDTALHAEFSTIGLRSALRVKIASNVLMLLTTGIWESGGFLLAAFLIALFVRCDTPALQSFRLGTLGAVIAWILVSALFGEQSRTLGVAALFPLLALATAAGMRALIAQQEWFMAEWEQMATVLFVILVALPAGISLMTPPKNPYPPVHPRLAAAAGSLAPRHEVICSDIPAAIAWYSGRAAVLLPDSVAALSPLQERFPTMRTVHVTTETSERAYSSTALDERAAAWIPLLKGEAPEGFSFTNAVALPPGRTDQWIFTERTPTAFP